MAIQDLQDDESSIIIPKVLWVVIPSSVLIITNIYKIELISEHRLVETVPDKQKVN